MMFRDLIKLVSVTITVNELGNSIPSETTRDVFADKQSIRQSEFYQAQASGLKPELMFVIRTCEYNQENVLQYNGKEYRIIRSYDKNGEYTELVCSGFVGIEVR